jgi:hypothetical protein
MVNYGQLIDGPKPFVQGGLDGVYTFAPNLMQDSGINGRKAAKNGTNSECVILLRNARSEDERS